MKKTLISLLVVCLAAIGIGGLTSCKDNQGGADNGQNNEENNQGGNGENNQGNTEIKQKIIEVSTIEELNTALKSEENDLVIKLTENLDLNETLRITRKLVLDLNGKTITNTSNIWQNKTFPKSWSLISVGRDGDLTINGNGLIDAKENDCFAIDMVDGGKCCLENGTYIGNLTCIYVNLGELKVNGGMFSLHQLSPEPDPYRFVLNCYDENYQNNTAKIVVTGGTFKGFNPGDSLCEGDNTNFLKEGYMVVTDTENPINYTVKKSE